MATERYRAYGLTLDSDFPLPALETWAGGGAPELRVLEVQGRIPGACVPEDREFLLTREEAIIPISGVGVFVMREGRELRAHLEPDASRLCAAQYATGSLMGVLLYQRGNLVLHASSVRCGAGAIAVMGPCGAGKSSVAAALYSSGLPLTADDNTAIHVGAGKATVLPGGTDLKVFPAAAEVLGIAPAELRFIDDPKGKSGYRARREFSLEPVPLEAIYFLAAADSPEPRADFERFKAAEALWRLLTNSVPGRQWERGGETVFRDCAWVANQIPMYSVRTFSNLQELPRVARGIREHAEQHVQAARAGVAI